jgi:YesN/AraC family two-component response regulator
LFFSYNIITKIIKGVFLSTAFDDILILIVAPSLDDRLLLTSTLSKYFNNIVEAENGKIAYDIFKEKNEVDIIISDIDMPELNGIDLLKLVRMTDLHIPFILTNSEFNSELLLKAIEFNVSSFLLKPIDLSKLLEKIDLFSEQRITEKKLTLKQKEMVNYLEAVDKVSLIYKMHENGHITYMNDSMKEVSKYSDKEIKNLNFRDIIHPDIPTKYIDETWDQIKSDKLWRGNTKFLAKDKEVFYLNNTIFKINNLDEDEYITISFLNTKENLEKRDFHKKVLLNIKEANRKETELKITIDKLNKEISEYRVFISDHDIDNLDDIQDKLINKEKQIKLLEVTTAQFQEKYENMLRNKKEEMEHHINNTQKHKITTDKVKEEIKKLKKEVDTTHKKMKVLLSEHTKKDKIIKDLRFIINEMDNK